ncbi:MAG: 4-hydroxy-tetrahydrodipicolinate reductase [Lachnospiraceae bacterium]|nr:4-hydroxy-tetrahydrodipicolinate reductase [Lachnospiraceae bacterium]
MLRIILHGCCGAMGKVVTRVAADSDDIIIAAGIDRQGTAEYPVYRSCSECREEADVIVDFSTAAAVDELIEYAGERGIPLVLCTTGLSEEQLGKVNELSLKSAVLRSANMSLGINLLLKLAAQAAQVLAANGFDIEITEKHHHRKLDAPSGTAIAIADEINSALGGEYYYKYDRSQQHAARDPREIGIQSLRGGNIVGEHDVYFCGQDEIIEIKHTAYSREIFANGAIAAARFLAGKGPGLYSMADVIG